MESLAFDAAVNHAMLYEVGGHWELNDAACQGLIDTRANRISCGYVNDPDDAGGETKYGISKNANPDVDISSLDWDGAKEIYYNKYWLAGKCDELPGRIAVLHFDGCVNHGVGRANKFLQKALAESDSAFENLNFEDIGPSTLDKLESQAGIDVCNSICDQREKFYRDIVANKPSQAKFLNGWLRRIKEMREFVTDPDAIF